MPVKKQHVVSQVVLKRWVVEGNVAEFDLRNGRKKLKSPAATAYVEWFVQSDYSAAIERVWQEVETRVPDLLGRVESGAVFDDDDSLDWLRQLVAAHIIRSKQMATMWQTLYEQQESVGRLAHLKRTVSTPEVNRLLAEYRSGLILPFDMPASVAAEPFLQRLDSEAGPGGSWFVELALTNHAKLLELLRTRFLQIGRTESGGLIIGDNPATTYDPARNVAGLLAGANLTNSTIVMPITPQYVISFGRPGGYLELAAPQVQVLNDVQLATAEHHVYAVPGTAAADDLAVAARAESEHRATAVRGRPDSPTSSEGEVK